MASSPDKNLSLTVLTLSMAVLVVGLGLGGSLGILLNVVAIVGCVIAIVLSVGAGKETAAGKHNGGGGGS